MNKVQIINNDTLKDEIKALYDYINRDEYNLKVVEVMLNELENIVKEQLDLIKEWAEK